MNIRWQHINLLFQNLLTNFNQTWCEASPSLGEGDSATDLVTDLKVVSATDLVTDLKVAILYSINYAYDPY